MRKILICTLIGYLFLPLKTNSETIKQIIPLYLEDLTCVVCEIREFTPELAARLEIINKIKKNCALEMLPILELLPDKEIENELKEAILKETILSKCERISLNW